MPIAKLRVSIGGDSFAFANRDDLVHLEVRQVLYRTAGPADFYLVDFLFCPQSKVQPQVMGRAVATAAPHLVEADKVSRPQPNSRSNSIAIAARSYQLQCDPVIALRAVIAI